MSRPPDQFEQAYELHRAGRWPEAVQLYQQVIQANPRHAHAWHQLGCIAFGNGQLESAVECFVRAIRLDGGQAMYHANLGECCRLQSNLADAKASFEQALRLDPNCVSAHANLSLTLYGLGRTAEADRTADLAVQTPRSTAEEHALVATLRLLRGDYLGGWQDHEWRAALPGHPDPTLPGPKWDGRPLKGQRILLWAEQGLGDALQFVRYVPQVIVRGGRPVLWAPSNLLPLLAEANLCELAQLEQPPPNCELHSALLSLSWAFQTTVETIPTNIPYLRANPQRVERWHQRLAGIEGFRVGISWQGNPRFCPDRARSIPLREFAALSRVGNVRLVSLQKNTGVEQLESLAGQFDVVDLGTDFDAGGAFMDTAAVMRNLDLVVTSDTAIAHLAGALGVPTWVVLQRVPDWRWMLDRSDSPWYPSMRLFRQERAGDWCEVLGRVASELAAVVGHGMPPRSA